MRTRAEPRTTIKDIARETGVTGASVSRVLNDPHFGSVETRKRVLEAVRRLGYSPNHAARGLVRQASTIIGLCINDIENPFCAAFARGIEDAANRHGYTVALCNTDENPLKELAYVHTLLGWQVAGLILSATHSAG
ncbi:MAG: transcriptional regulator, LacI family, partial [Firmicutes bacterium]|nr:transcriptional regulator, LacI family [Bacillota bacterium]